MSINVAKWTSFLSLCASRITSFLLLTSSKFHAVIVSSSSIPFPRQLLHPEFPSLVASEKTLCTKLKCVIEVNPCLQCDLLEFWIAKIPLVGSWDLCDCFGLIFIANFRLCSPFRDACLSFTRHGGSHRSFFQFSPRIFENFCIFFVVWNNKRSLSSIAELRFLCCPFFFSTILSGFYLFSSKLLAIHDLVWQSFESLSVSHRNTCILMEVSFQ